MRKFSRTFGILGFAALLVLLALTWLGYLPESTYVTALLLVVALILMYVTVKLVLQRDRRVYEKGKKPS